MISRSGRGLRSCRSPKLHIEETSEGDPHRRTLGDHLEPPATTLAAWVAGVEARWQTGRVRPGQAVPHSQRTRPGRASLPANETRPGGSSPPVPRSTSSRGRACGSPSSSAWTGVLVPAKTDMLSGYYRVFGCAKAAERQEGARAAEGCQRLAHNHGNQDAGRWVPHGGHGWWQSALGPRDKPPELLMPVSLPRPTGRLRLSNRWSDWPDD
jgi:hypothetical protein